jgi:hypothetical protein
MEKVKIYLALPAETVKVQVIQHSRVVVGRESANRENHEDDDKITLSHDISFPLKSVSIVSPSLLPFLLCLHHFKRADDNRIYKDLAFMCIPVA